MSNDQLKRGVGQRGKGKRPALQLISLRLPPEVLDFYRYNAPEGAGYTDFMRSVLISYYALKNPNIVLDSVQQSDMVA